MIGNLTGKHRGLKTNMDEKIHIVDLDEITFDDIYSFVEGLGIGKEYEETLMDMIMLYIAQHLDKQNTTN